MSTFNCTKCEGTGFLNLCEVDDDIVEEYMETRDTKLILDWIDERNALMEELGGCRCNICPPCTYCVDAVHNVQVCDCCGDGNDWYGEPGKHDWDNDADPKGCQ